MPTALLFQQALRALALLLIALLPLGVHANPAPVATITLMPWDFAREPNLAARLAESGFNHATLYVPWRDVEPVAGQFQFDKFDRQVTHLKQKGISVILLLDFGGRVYFDDNGTMTESTVVPTWFALKAPEAFMRDFSGNITRQLSFTDPLAREHVERFIDAAVRHFLGQHQGAILGFAIGLQDEHEIKYGQTGYSWRDYSERARQQFAAQHRAALPVINYNNEIGQVRPHPEPLLSAHRRFREAQLKEATCRYARVIQKHQASAIGYFGETFTSHDAIYATGIVEELADCIDIAIIDFNFYDGYALTPNVHTLPMLANYLAHSGYRRIMVGGYAERWNHAGKLDALLPTLKASIEKALQNPAVVGYEIGGFQGTAPTQSSTVNFGQLSRLKIVPPATATRAPHKRIGVFASKSNFYFWHGERSHGRNLHQEALTQAYALLSAQPDFAVSVIGEKALRDAPALIRSLDAIVVPHQAALPDSVKQQLKAYWSAGGTLVQDLRLGEFRDDGTPTNDWLHDVFGIKSVHWSREPAEVVYQGAPVQINMGGRSYANHAVLEARPGFQLGARLLPPPPMDLLSRIRRKLFGPPKPSADSTYGVLLRGPRSLAFGFLPQLVEGPSARRWQQAFVDEIRAAVGARPTAPVDAPSSPPLRPRLDATPEPSH